MCCPVARRARCSRQMCYPSIIARELCRRCPETVIFPHSRCLNRKCYRSKLGRNTQVPSVFSRLLFLKGVKAHAGGLFTNARRARLRQPEPRRGRARALAPSPYERCQAIFGRLFGRIVCRLHKMGSWVVAGFSDRTPYPTGKRSDGGAVGKVCRGCDEGIFGTFLLRGIGLTVLLQLPNSYPCIRTS